MPEPSLHVAVTTSSFGKVGREPLDRLEAAGVTYTLNPHGRKLTASETEALLRSCDGVVAGTEPYTDGVLAGLPGLRVISRVGVGLNSIDLDAASERGVTVLNTPDAHVDPVAELTIAGILASFRDLAPAADDLRGGTWSKRMGRLLRGATVGIVGTGRVGRRLTELLRPFDVELYLYDVVEDAVFADACQGRYCSLNDLLGACDVVSLHVPLMDETRGFFGQDQLQKMRPDALLVNTSRGGLIDEAALLEHIQSHKQFRVYLDVFETEPYAGPLAQEARVLVTPHMGGYAREGRLRMETEAVDNLLAHFGLA